MEIVKCVVAFLIFLYLASVFLNFITLVIQDIGDEMAIFKMRQKYSDEKPEVTELIKSFFEDLVADYILALIWPYRVIKFGF